MSSPSVGAQKKDVVDKKHDPMYQGLWAGGVELNESRDLKNLPPPPILRKVLKALGLDVYFGVA
jgi:hypothetical protein